MPDEAADTDRVPEGYAEAVTELEAILAEVEGADVDVDLLATKVARANVLIEFCRARISAAQDAVDAAADTKSDDGLE